MTQAPKSPPSSRDRGPVDPTAPVPPASTRPHGMAAREVDAENGTVRVRAAASTSAPGWSARLGWSAGVGFLLAAAAAGYVLGYVPQRARRIGLEHEMAVVRQRLADLHERERRAEGRIAALRAGDRDTVARVLRDQLGHGAPGEYVLPAP